MPADFNWLTDLSLDVHFGYLGSEQHAPKRRHPQLVDNDADNTALRVIREELASCESFLFSVAFVSPRAIALLLTDLMEFQGEGRIVTSDYLAFNSPVAFAELLRLQRRGIDVRIHRSPAFHPKGYIFGYPDSVTAMLGSSNFTETALVRNHEWNLRVSAARSSDLGRQLRQLAEHQLRDSVPLTQEWVDQYAAAYTVPPPRPRRQIDGQAVDALLDSAPGFVGLPDVPGTKPPLPHPQAAVTALPIPANCAGTEDGYPPAPGVASLAGAIAPPSILPNRMQREALAAIAEARRAGAGRALVISATGTGKTILSALDVRSVDPARMLFIVHREQILDRAIDEFAIVLGRPRRDFGKLTGTSRQLDRPFVFATIQTLSKQGTLTSIERAAFDYVLVDEVHRIGASSYLKVLNHLRPKFLLGMTATPERTDGFNVYELFDYVVPYEIRLQKALEEEMLAPFHYYGIADITFEDGTSTDEFTLLARLTSPERVRHLLNAIESYAQVGINPRGLVFCSRKEEARQLSAILNHEKLNGHNLKTVALTGDDDVKVRELSIEQLERGELDYILTVDVFNEGVDIPSVNQIIMLRQTQSSIVFVQQLGRGLRKAAGKEYLVVIDFIGNYANNYLIPIALFGDESLNKESLRQNLIAAEEIGVVAGLSSVRFDKIAQARVLAAISKTALDDMVKLRTALTTMRDRVGRVPRLWDFWRFKSTDPVVLATRREHYPALVQAALKELASLTPRQDKALGLLSHEVLTAKRPHEALLLKALLTRASLTREEARGSIIADGRPTSDHLLDGVIDTFTLEKHAEADQRRYQTGVVVRHSDGSIGLTPEFRWDFRSSPAFRSYVDDLVRTGEAMSSTLYDRTRTFTPGRQYSRKEVCRLLGWPRKWTSTIYGYRADVDTGVCPIFVTLHKGSDITSSTAYEDAILDQSTMLWYTRSRRTLASPEVDHIVQRRVTLHIFVKKDDAEGSQFYYLGEATPVDVVETTMADDQRQQLPVVRMHLKFAEPVRASLFDYFHPVVTL